MNERDYMLGKRAAVLSMLRHCMSELETDDPEVGKAQWIIEREDDDDNISAKGIICGMIAGTAIWAVIAGIVWWALY